VKAVKARIRAGEKNLPEMFKNFLPPASQYCKDIPQLADKRKVRGLCVSLCDRLKFVSGVRHAGSGQKAFPLREICKQTG
jgi:hypothetical protein